jgi:RNA polymerase sigma factor (sigma-70 family)
MAAFYGGDPCAFDALTDRWWRRLLGFFHRLGFAPEDAEDLAQETLLRLHLTRETLGFDVRQPLARFLLKVAHNLAIERWRKVRRRPPPLNLDEELVPLDPPAGLSAQMLLDLFHCIERLPDVDQRYILLCGKHGLGDCDHLEIAAVLERSAARVTQISQRALGSLKQCMSDHGY